MSETIKIKGKYGVWDVININGVWYQWCGSKPGNIHLFKPTSIELRIKKNTVVIIGIKPPEEGDTLSYNGVKYQIVKERVNSYVYDAEIVSDEWKWKDESLEMF